MASPATTYEKLAAELAEAAARGNNVRPTGGGTKARWGNPGPEAQTLSTKGLDALVEHNPGDLTAVVQAGMPIERLQGILSQHGQMLALDPPCPGGASTVGGVVATADSGPLRHRYGGVRDLVLGIAVAVADGSVARAGGKVIKNVAGYDLAKLYCGSFGTLGVILEVAIRLHPRPAERRTIRGQTGDPAILLAAATSLSHLPLNLESLDVSWAGGGGALLARVAGAGLAERTAATRRAMTEAGLEAGLEAAEADDVAWAAQREAQRCDGAEGMVVRVSGLPSRLADIVAATPPHAGIVGRAGLGISWVRFPPASAEALVLAVKELRDRLAPMPCVVLDAPDAVRRGAGAWGPPDPARAALERRVKERFDPLGILNPGIL